MQLNQIIDWLQGRRAEQAARLTALAVGVWVLYRLATLVWALVPAPELAEAPAPAPATCCRITPRHAAAGHRSVMSWHLFGVAAQTEATGGPAPIDAPDTRLNLVLRGVLSSDQPRRPARSSRNPMARKLFPRRLGIAWRRGTEGDPRRPHHPDAGRPPRNPALAAQAMEGAANSVPATTLAAGPGVDAGRCSASIAKQLDENPQALLDLARVVRSAMPTFRRVPPVPRQQTGAVRPVGLHRGSGQGSERGGLDNPARGNEAMQQLRESSQLALRIERGGQEINLAVDIP